MIWAVGQAFTASQAACFSTPIARLLLFVSTEIAGLPFRSIPTARGHPERRGNRKISFYGTWSWLPEPLLKTLNRTVWIKYRISPIVNKDLDSPNSRTNNLKSSSKFSAQWNSMYIQPMNELWRFIGSDNLPVLVCVFFQTFLLQASLYLPKSNVLLVHRVLRRVRNHP